MVIECDPLVTLFLLHAATSVSVSCYTQEQSGIAATPEPLEHLTCIIITAQWHIFMSCFCNLFLVPTNRSAEAREEAEES